MNKIPLILSVAGSDSSAGAGMQADLKTFQEYNTFGFVALTSIVTMDVENNWSHAVTPLEANLLREQLNTILSCGNLDGVKTGMLPNLEIIQLVNEIIDENKLKNIVIDPVMVCKGDDKVLNPECAEGMKNLLLPFATVTTPNLFEAGVLSGKGTLKDIEDMKEAAKIILSLGAKNVVIKGGKSMEGNYAIDLFYDGNSFVKLEEEKIKDACNHGAGCTFAAAITAGLGKGFTPAKAVEEAKKFVTKSIKDGFYLNKYVGTVYHGGIH